MKQHTPHSASGPLVAFTLALALLALPQTARAQSSCYANNQVINQNQVCTQIGYAQTQDCANKFPTNAQYGADKNPGSGAANVVSIYIMNYSNLYLDNWVVASGVGGAYLASPLPTGVGTSQGNGYNFQQANQLPTSPASIIQVSFNPTNLNSSSLAFQFNALSTTSVDFKGNALPNGPAALLYTVDFAIGALAQTPPPPSLAAQIGNFVGQLAFASLDGYAAWSANAADTAASGRAASAITTVWQDMQGILSAIGGGQSGYYTPVYNAQVTAGTANIGEYGYSENGNQLYTIGETSNGSQIQVYDQVFSLVGLQTCPPAFALVVQSYPLYLNTFVNNSCNAQTGCPADTAHTQEALRQFERISAQATHGTF